MAPEQNFEDHDAVCGAAETELIPKKPNFKARSQIRLECISIVRRPSSTVWVSCKGTKIVFQ